LDFLSFLTQSFLTDYEWFQIQSVQNSYSASVQLNQITGIASYPDVQPLRSTAELFSMPLYISSMRLITFIKQIPEFQQINPNDQVSLVKLNLIVMIFLHSLFLYNPSTNTYHEADTTDPIFSHADWIQTFNGHFHADLSRLQQRLFDIFQNNDIIIKLLILILLFSNRLSVDQAAPQSCSITIFHAQNVFTDLLYKYFLHQFGIAKAPGLFARCVSHLIQLQTIVDEIKQSIHHYVNVSELSPLMESLLL
jgi:hypothetical protein